MHCRSKEQYRLISTLARHGMSGVLPVDILASELGISRRRVFGHLADIERSSGLIKRQRGRYCSQYQLFTYPRSEPPSLCHTENLMTHDLPNTSLKTKTKTEVPNLSTGSPNQICNQSVSNPKSSPNPKSKTSNLTLGGVEPFTKTGVPSNFEPWRFNHPALRDIFRELEIEFRDDYDNLVTRCFMNTECLGHRKPTLYLKCSGDKAGVWRCFRCERSGYVDDLIRAWTGWGVFRAGVYMFKHQAYEDPTDVVQRTYDPVVESDLRQYQYRHVYCYDRGLDEETCVRYQLGFDQNDWMITFPIFALDGKLMAVKKRAVTSKVFQYLPTVDHAMALFGLNLVPPGAILWVCEGEFDAMYVDQMLRSYGFSDQGAIALSGKHISDQVLPQLQAKSPVFFVLALDNDKEGQEALPKLHHKLVEIAPSMKLQYESEKIKDPNESSARYLAAQARKAQSLAFNAKGSQING